MNHNITLDELTQGKVNDGIALIKHWLNNGYTLEFAISQFNSCSVLGAQLRQEVYKSVGYKTTA
jgi:hypothetical protein